MMPTHDIDETLLTAYALGELDMDPDERERVAAHVDSNISARRFVDDVRESAGLVVGALSVELVDGLTEFQHEMIERRLSELHGAPQPLPFRPTTLHAAAAAYKANPAAAAKLARASRFRRWIPTLASAAASILIVVGTLGFFLKFNQHKDVATNAGAGSPSTTPAPKRPTTMVPVASATNLNEEPADVENDVVAMTADDEGPVEGVVEPKSAPPKAKRVKKAPAKAPTAVASAKKPAAPAPAAAAAAVAVKAKTMRSPDAVEVKRTSVASAMIQSKPGTARAPKTVNASPVRDAQALDKTAKTGPAKEPAGTAATPKLFANAFRTTADRPTSSFRVPPVEMSYKRVKNAFENNNRLPSPGSARVEELLNHFAYSYPAPTDNLAVTVSVEVATCPWDVNHRLARIALRARDARPGDRDKLVASDLTTAVHFNAASASAWRLIGYENGEPAPHGTFPAADLNAGRAVTALYEIVPVAGVTPSTETPSNLFTVNVTYRDTVGGQRETIKAVAADTGAGFDRAGNDFRFAASVAAFGMLVRDSAFAGTSTYADVIYWAGLGKGADEHGERAEFIELAKRARDLSR
jgi:hypothetical protein